MNKHFAIIIVISFVTFFSFSCSNQEKHKPNILFIAVDDLRPELGCYGNDVIQSPNIDKLAKQGRIFKNHFVQVPTCGASRYSLLTGLRPRQKSHLRNDTFVQELSNKEETENPESFIHYLKRNGYYTVGLGKISHSPDNRVYGYTEEPSETKELPHSYNEFIFNPGKWKTGWNAFFGYSDGENRQSMKRKVRPYESGNVEDNGYPDGLTTELAIQKLKEMKDKGKTFFLGVGFFKPHLPFTAPKKYWDLYKRNEISLSPSPFIPQNVDIRSLHNSGEINGYHLTDEKAGLNKAISDDYARKLKHAYFASVSYVDAQVGKIINELNDLDLAKNTIIIIWGDHGWHLGDHLTWGKHTLFERSLNSPLIVKLPEVNNPGISTSSIVESVDIYPTLLDLCDLEPPYQLDGKSLVDLIHDPNRNGKDIAYSYYNNGISVRTSRYRLTKFFRDNQQIIELYDHVKDPNETINIANNNVEIVNELMPLLEKGNTGLYN